MNFSLQGLVASYQALRREPADMVLATLINTEGSTYLKAGARMLITEHEHCHGLLGGQELHRMIAARSRSVFAARGTEILELEAGSDDAGLLGMEIEPGARLTVLLEYLPAENPHNTMELLRAGLGYQRAILATVCESALEDCVPGANVLIAEAAILHGDPDPVYCRAMADIAEQISASGKPALESCISGDGSFTAFYDVITPAPQLLILGAGPDAVPVLRLALELGWTVTIADPRAAFTQAEYLHPAHRILTVAPEALTSALDINRIDAVVIMTHRFDFDQGYLQSLRGNTRLKYIGLLGTRQRKEKLLRALSLDPAQTGEHIFGPVGLDLGGRSPEQIALALLSEIQAVLNDRKGGQLSAAAQTGTAMPATAARTPAASEMELYAVVLAAGGSRRFGGIKQLLELDGKSLLKRVIDLAGNALGNRVKLVLGIKHNKLQREADGYDLEIVVNQEWEHGVASSLRAGIRALPARCQGALILFCDQPYIKEAHLRRMIEAWLREPARIVASAYADTLGVPAIFPSSYFTSIMALQGDTGAKSIIEKNLENVTRVSIPEAAIDIDTQDDLIKILNQ
jgi:xanthine/CO dehydrogenase XdhC/CoxF family maturation factor/CTP:molybdopterin cytidylyltransferase MocA